MNKQHKTRNSLIEYMLNYLSVSENENALSAYIAGNPEKVETVQEILEFMDEFPAGFLIYRADGGEEILHANKALIKIFRCNTLREFKELTGNSFKGIVFDGDLDSVENSITEQISCNDDEMDYVEYRIRRKDGEIRWVEDFGHFLRVDNVGDIFYVFISDITEERTRRLKEADTFNQEHLRRLEIIEGLSENYDTILYADLDKDKVLPYRVTARTEDDFKEMYKPRVFSDFVKDYLKTRVHPEDKNEFTVALAPKYIRGKLSEAKSYFLNYRVVFDGEIRHLQLRVVNVGSEKHVSQIVIGSRDIEEEINRDRRQTQVLEEALSNAKFANEAKNAFLSNMSHDMRTPLNAILGFTAIAKKECGDNEHFAKIEEAGKQLLELIDKVLVVSELETACGLDEGAADIKEIVESAVKEAEKAAAKKNIEFKTDVSSVKHNAVVCDGHKLGQAIGNLAANAVQYTESGTVEIKAEEKRRLTNGYAEFVFTVTDSGIGIENHRLEKIFEPFERIRNTTASGISGAGLGLTIVKRYIEAMHGTVEVESESGKGSKFTVTVILRVQDAENHGEELSAVELVGKRILLVDDNELNLELEKEILEELGFNVETAEDGSIAVEKVAGSNAGEYDIVLMDIQMPIMDGRQATENIRKLSDPRVSDIPIIALSANAFESDKRRSLECGMDAHLCKPIDVPVLLSTMSEVLKNR